MRALTSTQVTNVNLNETRPIYIVEWQHSGSTEYLSCTGEVTYDSQVYVTSNGSPDYGGVDIRRIEDSKTATLTMPATSTRITETQNGSWRAGTCKITCIPATPVDTGSPLNTYDASEGILILDGIIEKSTFSGEVITVTAKSKYYSGAIFPNLQLSDVASHIPAVGESYIYNGIEISHEQWLKTTAEIQRIARPGVNPVVHGRQSTSQTNEFSDTSAKTGYTNLSGEGVYLPVIYGRASVPGYVIATAEDSNGDRIVAVAWCLGEVYTIEKVFVSDTELPGDIAVQHYRGTTWQAPNPGLASFITGYDDKLIYTLPDGDVGVCYSIFNLGTNVLSQAPKFRAIIKGRLVTDPDAASNSDPFYDDTQLSVDFTTGTTDSSQNAHTVTVFGGGDTSPPVGLECGGSPAVYATVSADSTLALGSNVFTIEMRASVTDPAPSPEVTETLLSLQNGSPTGEWIRIDRVQDELYAYISTDGSTWDVANGTSGSPIADLGTIVSDSTSPAGSPYGSPANYEFDFKIERVENSFFTYINGGQRTRFDIPSTSPESNFADTGGADWEIGHYGGTQVWEGKIKNIRATIGVYRYGSVHNTLNEPFADSGTYSAQLVYSNKPALAWNDLASDSIIGLGASTTNVSNAVAYGDEMLAVSPEVPRCRIGLALTKPKRIEQWLDLLATHSSCIWYPDGADLRIQPDRPIEGDNPLGDELVTDGDFVGTSPESWTAGSGWTLGGSPAVASYSPTSPLSQSPVQNELTQTLTTEDGVLYSVSFDIVTASSDSPMSGVSVNFGGTEVIATQTAVGTYTATVEAVGTSNDIDIIAETTFDGAVDNISVKRSYYPVTEWIRSSLTLDGLPDSNVPQAVKVNYTIPSDTAAAWKQDSFTVMRSDQL